MRVDVIIPTVEHSTYLGECVAALTAQTYRKFTATLVINGPGADRVRVSKVVRCLRIQNRLGFSQAVNTVLRNTDADLALVLNDDCILATDCLQTLVSNAKDHPGFGSYALAVHDYAHPHALQSAGLTLYDRGYGNATLPADFQPSVPCEVFAACGAAAAYRVSALRQVGLFNERYRYLFEDLELGYRLRLHGYQCLFLPEAKALHVGRASMNRHPEFMVLEAVTNALRTTITCTPARLLRDHWTKMLRFYTQCARELVAQGFSMELVRGVTRVVRELPWLLHTRAQYQDSPYPYDQNCAALVRSGPIRIRFPHQTRFF